MAYPPPVCTSRLSPLDWLHSVDSAEGKYRKDRHQDRFLILLSGSDNLPHVKFICKIIVCINLHLVNLSAGQFLLIYYIMHRKLP